MPEIRVITINEDELSVLIAKGVADILEANKHYTSQVMLVFPKYTK